MKTDTKFIDWHTAFFEAIQMELEKYSQGLDFAYEYQLAAKPLKIDVVIIKKPKDVFINKNIASIFRMVNILEYKSPVEYREINF